MYEYMYIGERKREMAKMPQVKLMRLYFMNIFLYIGVYIMSIFGIHYIPIPTHTYVFLPYISYQ